MRRPSRLATIVCLAACAGGAALRAEDAAPEAPPAAFAVRSMHILHLPLLDFGAAQPAVPPPGKFDWTLVSAYSTSYTTTWHARRYHLEPGRPGTPLSPAEADAIHATYPQETVEFVDGEALRTALTARYGLTPSLSVAVEVPYLARGLTGLQSFIENFHKAFGIPENGRNEFPNGRFTVMLQYPGGPMRLTDFEPSSGIGDVTTTLSWRRPRSASGWTLGADLALKAPTGSASDVNGSGGWDGGVLAFAAWEGGRRALEADASLVVPGAWKVPVALDPSPFARGLGSVVYGFTPRTRAGFSALWAQSPFRDHPYGKLSKAGVEGGLGVEHDFGSRFTTRLMLTEQLPKAGDRADFGIVLGLRYR